MAERRMFAKTIIDSDAFLDMPATSQLLYFHLAMRADDDGFVNSPKKILRVIGCGEDDLKLLFAKKFLIPFDSGVVVIKHWKIHNYIQKDRYKYWKKHTEVYEHNRQGHVSKRERVCIRQLKYYGEYCEGSRKEPRSGGSSWYVDTKQNCSSKKDCGIKNNTVRFRR